MASKHFLVPTDFSEGSDHAARSAAALARDLGADLLLLHVVEDVTFHPYSYVGPEPDEAHCEKITARARRELERVTRELARDLDVKVEGRVARGQPATEIVRLVEGHDLVVLSTHGRTGFSYAILGSVADKVVRSSSVPVLSLKKPDPATPRGWAPRRPGRILYPTDLSENALAAVDLAVELAGAYDAKIDFVHVVGDPARHPLAHWRDFPATASEYFRACSAASEELLEEQVSARVPASIPVECIVRQSHPYDELLRLCDSGTYDLIVMTTHGFRGFKRTILGSLTEKMVRTASCPVLTTRGHHPTSSPAPPE